VPDASTSQAPSAQSIRRAKLFWEQATQDLKGAREKLPSAPLESAYGCFQAALNALTTVCYLNGRYQLPNFSTARMAALCAEFEPAFESLRAPCDELESVQHRSPFDKAPDPQALAELGRTSLAASTQVVDRVRDYLKEHRKRFFAP